MAAQLTAELRLALAQVDRVRQNASDQAASHQHLLDLLEAGDVDAAAAELEEHLDGAESAILERLGLEPDPAPRISRLPVVGFMRLVTWLVTNAVALAVAAWLFEGIWFSGPTQGQAEIEEKLLPLLVVALILGVVTAIVKPVLTLLTLPLVVLTVRAVPGRHQRVHAAAHRVAVRQARSRLPRRRLPDRGRRRDRHHDRHVGRQPADRPVIPAPRDPGRYRVALVCLGNICRSPMAHVVLESRLDDAGLGDLVEVTSSGTGGWHVGNPMDPRAAATLTQAGYDATRHRARQYDASWADRNDLVLAMDARQPQRPGGGVSPRVMLFRDFDPVEPGGDVPDPYYGGDAGFEEVLSMVERTSDNLVVAP